MSILADIMTALAGIASHANPSDPSLVIDNVYPDAAGEDIVLPFVAVRRTNYEPVNTLQGYGGITRSTYVFDCWAADKLGAMTLADQVAAAIEASSALPNKYREPASGDEYESQADQFVEPVQYAFWHT